MKIEEVKSQILKGHCLTKDEALTLIKTAETKALVESAAAIRRHFCGDTFNLCTIINGKSGRCGENCAYCAQSAHFDTQVEEYPLMSENEVIKSADSNQKQGVNRFSIVTSGKRLMEKELEAVCGIYESVGRAVPIKLCASHGLLSYSALLKLKAAGVERYHNNLETSENYFCKICTTHSYNEKIETIKAAKRAGLKVCSGGIIGLGETMEDRIDMALTLRELGVVSVPINVLNPIAGTPLAHKKPLSYEEVIRTLAVFRFILPQAEIRLAGGRALFPDKGKRAIAAGVNAAISGDMLTTVGIATKDDIAMILELGFEVQDNG